MVNYARRAAERGLGRLESSVLSRLAGEINTIRGHLGMRPVTLDLREEGGEAARPTEGAISPTTAPFVDLDGLVEQVLQRLPLSQSAASTAGAEAPQLNMDYLIRQVVERVQQAQPVAAAPPPAPINLDELTRQVAERLPKTDTRDTQALIKKALEDLDLADLADRVYEDLDLDQVAEKLAPLLVEKLMGDPKSRSELIQALAAAYWGVEGVYTSEITSAVIEELTERLEVILKRRNE